MMVKGLEAEEGKYFNILIYKNGVDLPAVKILRIQSNYSGGKVGKQDEIELEGKGNRLQFNAECDSGGQYTEYPLKISESGSQYLTDTVGEIAKISSVDGSMIMINRVARMTSKDGVWWPIEKDYSHNPILSEPEKQLPEPKRQLPE